MKAIKPYTQEIEEKMTMYYNSLSEKERRRYAAIEADKQWVRGNKLYGEAIGMGERKNGWGKKREA